MELTHKIDVVVPIYNAYQVLINCLHSLQIYQQGINQVILINDASSDNRIVSLIHTYAEQNNWVVINHEKNCGFVKTANQGLKYSQNHTILLNSDTQVSPNWIAAFMRAINDNPQLGTATPWSNNAEICSFPEFLKNNKIPQNINALAQILHEKYQPLYPVIPTAVGFCMLVTQRAKQQVGYFDEAHFGHGYGEENDYSLRIEQAGLSNILCDNAYVAHVGNKSFCDLGLKPDAQTMHRLLQKHPDYNTLIGDYIANDALATIREKILHTIQQENTELYQELKAR